MGTFLIILGLLCCFGLTKLREGLVLRVSLVGLGALFLLWGAYVVTL
jgi:hypothetical protein